MAEANLRLGVLLLAPLWCVVEGYAVYGLTSLIHTVQMEPNAGVKTCGVTWGNGTKDELENAGATFIIDRMEEILEIVEKTVRV